MALAVALGILEVVLPVFVFLGFAVGAGATGLLLLFGLDWSFGALALLFAVISGLAYLVLRLALGGQGGSARIVRRDINDDP
ncbi:hypothetical protein GT358_05765 [Rubellimicrobium sp. CFH 75288]|nr:hypothetical protein [Rubellimicrobium sp. CFH 75288]NAZ36325.1 hypothetical protein [Rubellimicrobium sp. CFH 75288]